MYNYEDILAALQSGESSEKLAKEFTEALNKAVQAQKAAADKEKIQKEKEKRVEEILRLSFDYMEDYLPEVYDESLRDAVTATSVINVLDDSYEKTLNDLSWLNMLFLKEKKEEKPAAAPTKRSYKLSSNPIDEFLRQNNLI